MQFSAFLKLRT